MIKVGKGLHFMYLEMTKFVQVQKVASFLLSQEKFFSTAELSYAKVLLKWIPYDEHNIDSTCFFDFLRSKKLKAHKQHAQFVVDVFEECGAHYAKFLSFW